MNNRRGFLKMMGGLVGGVAASAAVRTFPFRVFSFPTEIKPVTFGDYNDYVNFSNFIYYDKEFIEVLKRESLFENISQMRPLPKSDGTQIRFFQYSSEVEGARPSTTPLIT
jgi:hypothetical protein